MNEGSREILNRDRLENIGKRAIFKSMGFTDFELEGRPLIGIANAWNNICPGHKNLRALAEYVKNGIYAAGGTAVEFGVIGSCDGLTDGDPSGNYILPSRNLIADAVEVQARTSKLDGLVLLGSCDKIVPGMLMAAARLNLPAVFLGGGPMLSGAVFHGRRADQTTTDEAVGMVSVGLASEEELRGLEETACPTSGSCAMLGTANTMNCLAEALGMALPGSALVPAVYAQRERLAFESGRAAVELVRRNIRARDILTENALRNAVKVCQAICGSTNSVMHLAALAYEAELPLDVMREFEQSYAGIPQIVKVNPASGWDMLDFHEAGGIGRVMRNLRGKLEPQPLTVTGRSLEENLDGARFLYPENEEVIRPLERPFHPEGSLKVLRGNLAPDSAVTKPGAFDRSLHRFRGPARVFEGEQEASRAILEGRVKDGDVVVIRYEGPKGGPGMQEMYQPMKHLAGQGRATSTAVITDGRFSGTNNGCFVGHISPEAAEGGPLALVRDGDEILIDVEEGRLELLVSAEELARRREGWKPLKKPVEDGYLKLYRSLALSASRGGMIDHRRL